MRIELSGLGKKFNRDWIFKGINFSSAPADRVAIIGPNGSGKSTLLQVISGVLSPNEGAIHFSKNNTAIAIESFFSHITIAAPYLELPEEMTLLELIKFHFSFKKKLGFDTAEELISSIGLIKATNKEIRYFSSGMKQRVKLALALYSDVDCILLDEPTTNLDEQGTQWYLNLIDTMLGNRTIFVSSNQAHEYSFCNKQILIADYKHK
jgi:ATPase subunit of ABC transporter with duplicated ATPase domains